jgi:hypothetical protein
MINESIEASVYNRLQATFKQQCVELLKDIQPADTSIEAIVDIINEVRVAENEALLKAVSTELARMQEVLDQLAEKVLIVNN